jgi:hypothetical protein
MTHRATLRRLASSLLLITFGCSQATLPPVRTDADPETRQKTYEQWKLEFNDSIWLPKWKRNDGAYMVNQLERVANEYTTTQQIYSDAQNRMLVINLIAGLGGGVMGYAIGDRFVSEDRQLSDTTQNTLLGIGIGLTVTSLVTMLIWDDPMETFAPAYNAQLKAALNLPPE